MGIFVVTNLGKHKMIIGYPWLHKHNPEVNWKTQEVTRNHCPMRCHTCRTRLQEEQKEELRIQACRMGPMSQMVKEEEGDEVDTFLEPGDQLFATVAMHDKPVHVMAATATTLQ